MNQLMFPTGPLAHHQHHAGTRPASTLMHPMSCEFGAPVCCCFLLLSVAAVRRGVLGVSAVNGVGCQQGGGSPGRQSHAALVPRRPAGGRWRWRWLPAPTRWTARCTTWSCGHTQPSVRSNGQLYTLTLLCAVLPCHAVPCHAVPCHAVPISSPRSTGSRSSCHVDIVVLHAAKFLKPLLAAHGRQYHDVACAHALHRSSPLASRHNLTPNPTCTHRPAGRQRDQGGA